MQTIRMGKEGTLVLPPEVREQFGLDDGALIVTEVKDGELRLRRAEAVTPEPEEWGPEGTAYFLLINALTKEEWDRLIPDVLEMGVDPTKIEGIEPGHRETLPTDAEWTQRMRSAKRRAEAEQRLSA